MAEAEQNLGDLIRRRRQELGWSQMDLALALGDEFTQNYISRLERGMIGAPRRDRMERLADVLKVPMGVLLEKSTWSQAAPSFQVSRAAWPTEVVEAAAILLALDGETRRKAVRVLRNALALRDGGDNGEPIMENG